MGDQKLFRNTFNTGTMTVDKTLTASSDLSVTGDLAGTGTITASSGIVKAVVTPSSSENVPNHGQVILSATPATIAYGLESAPVIGQEVTFTVVGTTSINYIMSTTALVNGTTTVFIGSTAGNVGRRVELTGPGASVTMVGITTGLWGVTSLSGAGVVTTTTTT